MPSDSSAEPTGWNSANGGAVDRSKDTQESSSEVLSATRILSIMRGNEEVFVEVKDLAEDALSQQAANGSTSPISDEQLTELIVSNSDLRVKISNLLRARGYALEEGEESSSAEGVAGQDGLVTGEFADQRLITRPSDIAEMPDRARNSTQGASPLTLRDQQNLMQSPVNESRAISTGEKQNEQPNISDTPKALRRTAPYNLLSLRDLYTQTPDVPDHLKRFGSQVFLARNGGSVAGRSSLSGESASLDVPLGPDYVLGPGDELAVTLWGGVSQTFARYVNRDGSLLLPEAGKLQVAGLTLQKAEAVIGDALLPQYRNVRVAVTIARLRSIRIYVVGDVQRPGAYDIPSLATPLSALYAAGGPTAAGSLRVVRHYRNEKLIGEIDLYDFFLRGVRNTDDRLQGGDSLLVPPVGPQVAVFGAVKRPAIYELRNDKTLGGVFDAAGGLTVAAALSHITIDRIVANQHREAVSIDAAAQSSVFTEQMAAFEVKDGDRVRVGTVLPYTERVVYLQGHVARPGKLTYRDGLRLSDVLASYRDLLPEPASRGEIVRLIAPDLHPETISFSVPDVMMGNANMNLQPFDTIRVFGRYEQDAPTVTVRGEVIKPGSYPLFEGMTAAQLVRAAGGFKRDALLEDADLISYQVVNESAVITDRRGLHIGAAVLKEDHSADVLLKPGDVLTIHQLTGWDDIGASIEIEGEVAHPGSYGFKEGEHLSDLLRRAGGFRSTAYAEGAILTRPEVRALEEKSREELIRQIESSSSAARLSPAVAGGDQATNLSLIQQQQDQVLSRLKSQPASGRLVIRINNAIESWAGTSADIEVRRGDVLRVPKRPGFVLVSGQVYNASAITFVPGKSARWYLQHAGGATQMANRNEILVIQANGTVIGRRSGGWRDRDVLSIKLRAGDVIVVPQKIVGASLLWRNLLGIAQVAASITIAASVAGL
jgi:protein involved in polysaccharide export with SLBB domain